MASPTPDVMNTLLWVAAGVALFWAGAAALKRRGVLPTSLGVYGPLVTLRTTRGRAFLGRLAAPRRFWRMWGNLGLGVALMVMLFSTLFLGVVAVLTVLNPPESTAATQPQNVLVIPGVNDFLPLSVAPEILTGLAVGLVVHEAGHGILCRVEDIDIESLGLLFLTIIPAGAFVEQDIDSQWRASRGGRGRMLAAGVTNNFAVTIVAFLLLFGPVVGAVSVVPGAAVGGVLGGAPEAGGDGLDRGDVVVSVANQSVGSNDELDAVLRSTDAGAVPVETAAGDRVTVDRAVRVIGGVRDGPAGLAVNDTVTAVDGQPVSTLAGLYDAFAASEVVTVTDGAGERTTFATGAYVVVSEDGPLNRSGAPTGGLTVVSIDGTRTVSMADLTDELAAAEPGATVSLAGYRDDERVTYNVTLGEGADGSAFLGVFTSATGVAGLQFNDLGLQTYPAANYLCGLGGSCAGAADISLDLPGRVWLALQFPVVGVTANPVFPFNFAGFTGATANFYTAPPFVLLLANLLFWIGWVNLNLGVFNCIPTFALDGGHMLRTAVESVASRLPVSEPRAVVRAMTLSVQLVMLGSLLLLLFGAQLLG